jgi:fumarate reductase flavoprotein subunit
VEHQDFDVIVVGGGGAGLAAAIEANNAGASVLICEAAKPLGGSAAVSGGLFLAVEDRVKASNRDRSSLRAQFQRCGRMHQLILSINQK